MADEESVVRMNLARVDAATVVQREPLLDRSELLRALGTSRDPLLALCGVRRYALGSTIYVNGSEPDRVFLLARGEVAILSSHGANATPLASLHQGDCFGAGAALDPPVRAVTARAVTTVDLVELPADRLRQIAGKVPAVVKVLRETHQRLAGAKTELDDFLDRW